MFKRRDKRTWFQSLRAFLWPKGGWGRAFNYVKHRIRRLPDSPAKIGRGIWAGVFASCTPFFGLHFLFAAIIAKAMRGNILASLLATFFGNPITFPLIGISSVEIGYFLLGRRGSNEGGGLRRKFGEAWSDLKHNFWAMFDHTRAEWSNLRVFYDDIFYPYMVGGLIVGVVVATIAYILTVPMIEAYQNRRRKRLQQKLSQLKNTPETPTNEEQ